jgi:hypothetical protein
MTPLGTKSVYKGKHLKGVTGRMLSLFNLEILGPD